jgi:hypothetical protein
MNKLFLTMLVLFTLTCAFQCKKEEVSTQNEVSGNAATIKWKDCATFTDHNTTICIKEASEYRCPCTIDCIWEGAVDVTMNVQMPGVDSTITLTTNSNPANLNFSDTIGTKVIRFVKTNIESCADYGKYEMYDFTIEVTNL